MAVTDEAIERIKEMIVSGALRPGDRLPKESELAAELGAVPQLPARGGTGAVPDPHPRRTAGRRHVCHQPRSPTAAGSDELRRGLPPGRHRAGVPGGTAHPGAGRHGDGERPGSAEDELEALSAQLDALGADALGGGAGRRRPGVPSRHRGGRRATRCSARSWTGSPARPPGPASGAGSPRRTRSSRTLHEHRAILSALRDRDAEAAQVLGDRAHRERGEVAEIDAVSPAAPGERSVHASSVLPRLLGVAPGLEVEREGVHSKCSPG